MQNLSSESESAGAPPFLRDAAGAVVAGAVVCALAWLSLSLTWNGSRVAAIWPANAVILACLVRIPARRWPVFLAGGLIGNVLGSLLAGNGNTAVPLALCNSLQILGCGLILRRFAKTRLDLSRNLHLIVFALAALGVSVASAIAAAAVLRQIGGPQFLSTLAIWTMADTLGLIILTPALLALDRQAWTQFVARERVARNLALLALAVGVTAFVFLQPQLQIRFMVFVALFLLAYTAETAGAAIGLLAVGVVSVGLSASGHGPTPLTAIAAAQAALNLQAFMLACVVISLPLAAAMARRRELEATLAARAHDFQMLADYSTDLILRLDVSDTVLYVSPSCRRYGYEPKDLVGRRGYELVHPDDLAQLQGLVADLFSGAPVNPHANRAYRLRAASGEWIWVEGSPQIVRGPDGAPREVITQLRDITARKAAEVALAKSESLYRLMTEMSRDLVLKFDRQGTILYASNAARLFGYTPEELVGRDSLTLTHPDDIPIVEEMMQAALGESEDRRNNNVREYRVLTRDGRYVWVEGNPAITYDAAGRAIGSTNSLRDVTARRAAEEAMADSEARYRLLAEHATDIIIQYDFAGVLVYASPSCREMGYEPEELVGRKMLEFIHPDDASAVLERVATLAKGEPPVPGARYEQRIRYKDGTWAWLEGRPALVCDKHGAPIGAIAQLRNVTERRAMEDALMRRNVEAEAATVAKSEFLANMSHEIRTPLTGIIGFAGLLEELPDLPTKAKTFASRIVTASQTLLSVVNDVLDFSKIEAGQIELDPQPFDPEACLRETVELVQAQARNKGLTVRVEVRGELPAVVLADSSRVRQVLLNLLSNAIKFTAQGGVIVGVSYLAANGGCLRIAVTDTGVGIPAAQTDRLFQRFSQVDGSISRQYGGTGLGLAICRGLAESMGGAIGVESKEGRGSTFWFTVAAPVAELAAPAVLKADEAWHSAPARILVVDDVAVNRELVSAMLGSFGHSLTEASGGAEAVEIALHTPFDLILMDLQMPGMDGLAATRAIRAGSEANGSTPIVALSANVLPTHLDACREAGMDDHIAKPIDPADLLTKVALWTGPVADRAAPRYREA